MNPEVVDVFEPCAPNELRPWQGILDCDAALNDTIWIPARPTSGHAVGIITVDIDYCKLPGNVANASTFKFPVLYSAVKFEIEQLFAGDPAIEECIVNAALELEAAGVRAIVGACGFFAHFQKVVAAAVKVPVYMSSLTQVPLIQLGLNPDAEIAVIAADGASVTEELLAKVNATPERLRVYNIGTMPSFAPIRWQHTTIDNAALRRDMRALAAQIVHERPQTGAILLECSDLPPYAADVQAASGLPVYDFISLINWAHQAAVQPHYFGWI